jgi:hypothetical protein
MFTAAVHTTGQCYNVAGVPRLDLTECDSDDLILILDAFQGRHRHPQQQGLTQQGHGWRQSCRYNRDDCIEAVTGEMETRLATECVGRSKCSVTVDVGWMRRCNTYGQYSHVVYQCVPRESSRSTIKYYVVRITDVEVQVHQHSIQCAYACTSLIC